MATLNGKSLKGDNKLLLLGLITGNIAIFYGAIQSDWIMASDWVTLGQQLGEIFPAGLVLVLVGIINSQLSPERYYQKLWIGENPEEMKKAAYPIS